MERLLFFRISTKPPKHLLDHHIFGHIGTTVVRLHVELPCSLEAVPVGRTYYLELWCIYLELCICLITSWSSNIFVMRSVSACSVFNCPTTSVLFDRRAERRNKMSWDGGVLGHMCKTKTQVSLQICTRWSRRLLFIDINFTVSIQSIWKNKLEPTMFTKL